MRLCSIEIENFLSFRRFSWERIDRQCSVIVGPNGSGKTNLFWAIRACVDALGFKQQYPWDQSAHLDSGSNSFTISLGLEMTSDWERDRLASFVRVCLGGREALQQLQTDAEFSLGLLDDAQHGRMEQLVSQQIDRGYLADLWRGKLVAQYREDRRWDVRYQATSPSALWVWHLVGDGSSFVEPVGRIGNHGDSLARAVVRDLGTHERELLKRYL